MQKICLFSCSEITNRKQFQVEDVFMNGDWRKSFAKTTAGETWMFVLLVLWRCPSRSGVVSLWAKTGLRELDSDILWQLRLICWPRAGDILGNGGSSEDWGPSQDPIEVVVKTSILGLFERWLFPWLSCHNFVICGTKKGSFHGWARQDEHGQQIPVCCTKDLWMGLLIDSALIGGLCKVPLLLQCQALAESQNICSVLS